jgi:DNA-binding IscR family transcriptional regulator
MKAMIFIANSNKLVHISDIASAESISESLLRRIISDLDKTGIVKTIK